MGERVFTIDKVSTRDRSGSVEVTDQGVKHVIDCNEVLDRDNDRL